MNAGGNLLTVEEMTRRLGVTARTLHYYEEVGLVAPARRTEGGHRLYDEGTAARVEQILRIKEHLGYSLQEIHAVLDAEAALDQLRASYYESESSGGRIQALNESVRLLRGLVSRIDERMEKLSVLRGQFAERLGKAERLLGELAGGGEPGV